MIRADSMKIYAPADVITDICRDNFNHSTQTAGNTEKLQTDKLIAFGNMSGLKRIEIDQKSNQLQIELSAKILMDNYFELINKNTIEQVFDNINASGIIQIDKSRLNEFNTHSIDFTQNLKGQHKPHEYMDTCRMIINGKYICETYKGVNDNKNKTGITFRGKQKSFRERMIVYDKFTEITKDKKFVQSLNKQLPVINQFAGITRVENNVSQHRKIRELTETSNNLISILNSTAKPNYKLFQKIKGKEFIQTELFGLPETMKLYEIEKRYGREKIITDLGSDPDLIKDFLKSRLNAKNISRYVREYFALLNEMQRVDRDSEFDNEIMTEFEYLLKTA